MASLQKIIHSMLEFLKAPFLLLHFSYYTLITFLMMLSVILLSTMIIALCKFEQASYLCQELELDSELEFDPRDTIDWGRMWLVGFSVGKTQLVLFDGSNNSCANNMKIDGSVLDEKPSIKILVLSFSSKLDWGSHIVSKLLKLSPIKLEP